MIGAAGGLMIGFLVVGRLVAASGLVGVTGLGVIVGWIVGWIVCWIVGWVLAISGLGFGVRVGVGSLPYRKSLRALA